jgi:predicted enzyme related to lactoylglutathione lyase
MRIKFVSIPVSDQDRAKTFYAETLGFSVIADEVGASGARFVDLAPPAGGAGVALVTGPMRAGSLQGVVLEVDDIDSCYQRWSAEGVSFASPPVDQPWGRFAAFTDPDGNGWVLMAARATSS